VPEEFAPTQTVDVRVPTTNNRILVLPRYTPPDHDQKLLLSQLKLTLTNSAATAYQPPISRLRLTEGSD